MAPKNKSPISKAQKSKKQQVPAEILARLPTKKAQELFKTSTQFRKPLPESGISQKCITQAIQELFAEMKWEKLMQHPSFVLPTLTREFHAGIPKQIKGMPDPLFFIVRGKMEYFNVEKINEVLEMPDDAENLEDVVANATEKDIERLLRVLRISGTEWVREDSNVLKVRGTSLKPFFRSLSLWVMSTLMPTTHNFH